MALLPIPKDHVSNRRDDGYTDFAELLASGHVRDKRGTVRGIHDPLNEWSAHQRDALYQAFCAFAKMNPDPEACRRWVDREAAKLGMSPKRAIDLIGQGHGGWDSPNSMWWRGVSVKR